MTIENLTGSNFDDTLEGNAAINVLNGGLGIDTVSYANAARRRDRKPGGAGGHDSKKSKEGAAAPGTPTP